MYNPTQQSNPIVQQTVQPAVQSLLQPPVQSTMNTQTWPTKSPVENFSNPIQGPIPRYAFNNTGL